MKRDVIQSTANARVKRVRKLLQSAAERKCTRRFVIEGVRAVKTLAFHPRSSYRIEEWFVSEDREADLRLKILNGMPDVPASILTDRVMQSLSDVRTSQGILAVVERSHAPLRIREETGQYLLLDSVAEPGNVGTLIRSAVGAGFHGVLARGATADFYNPKAVRAAMGLFPPIDLHEVDDDALEQFTARGYEFVGADAAGSENVFHAGFRERTVLCVGSEARGISDDLRARLGRTVRIPLSPACESLNVAVAGSLCMFVGRSARRSAGAPNVSQRCQV
jgi:RNA methyltransferase, TrmH family